MTISADAPTSRSAPLSGSETVYSIAATRAERIAAFRLVYENYVEKGLIPPNPDRLRVTPFHLLPTTQVFIAKQRGEVVCTVTLIGDGELGLPMECIYAEEVEAARRRGLYVGEVSCLAVRDVGFAEFLPVFVRLTRLMAQHARTYGMHQFLVATHPKHARFYQRFMGFEQIGPYREYPSVRNAPAVACCLDFARIDRDRPACYDKFFGTPIPREELLPRVLSNSERQFFASLASRSGTYDLLPS